MKRALPALLVVMLVTASISFGVAYWLRCRACATPVGPAVHDAGWLTRELSLTEAQAGQVRALETEFRAVLGKVCEQHCSARADLAAALTQPKVDSAAAQACVERMCAAEADSERATLDHILKVRAVLSPEQQTRYSAAIQAQLQGTCPMRIHQP